MSKRNPGLARNARDFYATPEKAVLSLVPHLPVGGTYYEPCSGNLDLIDALNRYSFMECVGESDIVDSKPAETLSEEDINGAEFFITNPPWDTDWLHPIIDRLIVLRPTWLLLYSDWLFTRQAVPYQPWISTVVTMPRVIWIDGTTTAGYDNCCWVLFDAEAEYRFFQSGWK